MARKTIASLEEEVRVWKEAYELINKQYREFMANADAEFKGSAAYKNMQEELKWLTKEASWNQKSAENARRDLAKLQEDARRVFLDNKAFMKDKGGEYWIGISQSKKRKDYDKLLKEYEAVKAKLDVAHETIDFLREYIRQEIYKDDGEAVEIVKPKKSGPQTVINDELVKRVKKYRKKKYSLRAIAQIEGISLGLVQKILKG